ncbi:MAG TPA: hypothetical protein VIF14_11820 [Alphaproteobacteria bacterium]|jgi:hypothetical protein
MKLVRVAAALVLASAAPALAQQDTAAARAAFVRAAAVFQHPRCANCHNRGEGPRQGDAQRVHQLNVKRGPEGRGEGATRCTACHRATNTAGGAIPGAPDWRMPRPGNAGWDGLSPAAICAALKDPQRNAGLPLAQLVEHLEKDPLVNWAWEPGGIRKKPPLAKADFIALMRNWHAGGAPCPN